MGKCCDFLRSPPLGVVPDARIMAKEAGRTAVVVRWADRRRGSAFNALTPIVHSGGRLAGVVPAMVNFRKHAYYGDGDSGRYPGNTKKY